MVRLCVKQSIIRVITTCLPRIEVDTGRLANKIMDPHGSIFPELTENDEESDALLLSEETKRKLKARHTRNFADTAYRPIGFFNRLLPSNRKITIKLVVMLSNEFIQLRLYGIR